MIIKGEPLNNDIFYVQHTLNMLCKNDTHIYLVPENDWQ